MRLVQVSILLKIYLDQHELMNHTGEAKKYPWDLQQRRTLYDTLAAGYNIVDHKILIAYVLTHYSLIDILIAI